MSPFDSIYGWVMVSLAAIGLTAFIVIALMAWWYDRTELRVAAQEFEQSPYGPARTNTLCALRGHDYRLKDDGTYWVCVRGDDRVARLAADLDTIEAYANGEVA